VEAMWSVIEAANAVSYILPDFEVFKLNVI